MTTAIPKHAIFGVATALLLLFSFVPAHAEAAAPQELVASMSVRLEEAEQLLAAGDHRNGEVLVVYAPSSSGEERQRARDSVEVVSHTELMDDVELLTVKGNDLAGAIAALLGDPAVLSAEPNNTIVSTDVGEPVVVDQPPQEAAGSQIQSVEPAADPGAKIPEGWGVQGPEAVGSMPASGYGSNASGAWQYGYDGAADAVIAVIDSGVDINHPDLSANIWRNTAEVLDGQDNDGNGFVDDVNGWNFYNNTNVVYANAQDDYHGTHVAGTIAAAENGFGVMGVAPKTKILPVKFISGGWGTDSGAVAAINYVVTLKNQGVPITAINASWGGSSYSQAIANAIQVAGNNDILFVAAAGNSNVSTAHFPANFSCVTTSGTDCVISVASHDEDGQPSSFTNYNPSNVDVSAPGGDILSTYPDNQYAYLSGTSMAAPHVAALVSTCHALESSFPLEEKRSTVLDSVRAYPQFNGKNAEGGIIDVERAASMCGEARVTPYSGGEKLSTIEGVEVTTQLTLHGRSKTGTWSLGAPVAGVSITPDGLLSYTPEKYTTEDLLVRLTGEEGGVSTAVIPSEVRVFADVPPGSYYEHAVHWLKREGITMGTSPTAYSPAGNVTRAQMAAFLWRAEGRPSARSHTFRDEGAIPSYARTATDWLYQQGITVNDPYGPEGNVTRAQMAAFLWRAAGEPN